MQFMFSNWQKELSSIRPKVFPDLSCKIDCFIQKILYTLLMFDVVATSGKPGSIRGDGRQYEHGRTARPIFVVVDDDDDGTRTISGARSMYICARCT